MLHWTAQTRKAPTNPGCSPSCSSMNSPWGAVCLGPPGYCWNTQCMVGWKCELVGSGEELWLQVHRSRKMAPLGTWYCSSLQSWSAASRWCRCKSFHHHVPYLRMCGQMLCSKLCTLNQTVQGSWALSNEYWGQMSLLFWAVDLIFMDGPGNNVLNKGVRWPHDGSWADKERLRKWYHKIGKQSFILTTYVVALCCIL